MKKQNKNNSNYLDYIPCKNPSFRWDEDKQGLVTIYVENKGIMNRMMQKLLKKPKISQVHLETYGSFIWKQIDGTRTVLDIAHLADETFGEEIHPLYERLCAYVAQLVNKGFVTVNEK